jgi:glycolate oxidase FAD binding subunit
VRALHQDGHPWVPCGLGTRLHWGAPLQPAADGGPQPRLSTRQLKRILHHAVDDLTVTVEAGLPLAELQAALAVHNQWLPIDWPWGSTTEPLLPEPCCSAGSIGGLVARGLSGGLRQRHLSVRDQIIGIGLIRSDGISAHAGGRVVKNVAGYDLMRLLCGSWGSLALIHSLTLRTQPIRPARAQLQVTGALAQLEAWRAEVVASTLTPEWINWRGAPCSDSFSDPCSTDPTAHAWRIQMGIASVSDAAVEAQLSRLEALAAHHQLEAERHAWASPLPAPAAPTGPCAWLLRLALPPAQVADLLASRELTSLKGWRGELAAGAGSGDLWQVSTSAGDASTTPAYAVQAVRQRVCQLGGQLTVLIQPKPDNPGAALAAWLDAPARPLIEAVKREFDPLQQLSRGRLPGVATPYPLS